MSSAITEWRPSKVPGVSVKLLRNDKESGESAALVCLEPGASFPVHDHLVTLPKPVVILKDA